jgi:hypothetical protein
MRCSSTSTQSKLPAINAGSGAICDALSTDHWYWRPLGCTDGAAMT